MHYWNIAKSYKLYNIKYWSENYFNINKHGEIIASPIPEQTSINLYELAQELKTQGFSFPILVRFPDILKHRVKNLYSAFNTAMQQYNYTADYTPVYPIKVNQQQQVVKTILETEKIGLEIGSKAELMAALALVTKNDTLICNGYKDREYIQLALIGQKMGIHTYLIIEKFSDLTLILEEAHSLEVAPLLGIRIKLASIAKGKWQNSGGNKSKFGLNSIQILALVTRIKEAGFIKSLQLMHFHIGSQIANMGDIQKALCEAGRYYAELHTLGVPIHTIDVGGGLGIDYEGLKSHRPCSVNYSVQEYANNIIYEFSKICKTFNIAKPNIITETGRSITAHHAMLITDIIDIEPIFDFEDIQPVTKNDPNIIQDLWIQLNNINQNSALDVHYKTEFWLYEIHDLFSDGAITLKQRAHAEQLYYAICSQIRDLLQVNSHIQSNRKVLDALNDKLVDKCFTNFSLFQSAPDTWAIEQVFPIVPLQRLNEYPNHQATLQDLTCDSDGQFKKYVSNHWSNTSLPIHTLKHNEPYLIGIFLLGAYQEILADMHNLFGKPNSVNIHLTKNGNYELSHSLKGDTVKDMLNYVNFDIKELVKNYKNNLKNANLTKNKQHIYLESLKNGLESYTYLKV